MPMIRRIVAAFAILVLAGSMLVMAQGGVPEPGGPFIIRAEPVPLRVDDPDNRNVGMLRYLGGWVLTSEDPDFGGISAMVRNEDGFVAIGDAGGVFQFALDSEGAVSRAEIAMLPAGPNGHNGGAVRKRDRDAEAMAFDPEAGRYWVAFEFTHGIWRFDEDISESDAHHTPDAMDDWPDNGGAEAMVRLNDGRFLIFSEAGDGPDSSREVLLFADDPSQEGAAPVRLGYRPPAGYRITDAAQLPDGRLIVLNRSFSLLRGVSIIVSLVAIDVLESGTILTGTPIAQLEPPMTVDNMEALAIERRDGRTIVWMASDDNFNPLQRTLLMQFALDDE